MNKERRKKLKTALEYLDTATNIIEEAKDEEEDCLYNIPESLTSSERYYQTEANIDELNDAISNVYEAVEKINGVI